ncbi:uncharacterized protein LOC142549143 [Primulina tabacum]|uniref:uncharacterized protein LOC142549143 n=1 Tax=Primulina tabacum TaxID=48773 RepID=UPI003F5ACFD7
MHATLQPGDRSPKEVNTPSSTVQLKSGCDSGQNSETTFSAQVKGKKRDRADHGADSVRRERSSRANDEDYIQLKPGINLKSEIARLTEKGGVTDVDGVEKLIQLMQSDRMEINRDLLCRSMLAGVMAATDKVECLDRFVQLRGLPVLDEWLQEIHKGKIGDGSNLKDSDRSVEEFVLVLLRALDKLPVDLHALQTCNIGRSVNHLRSHKNLEIQKKARSLVDMWKKRVEAEMNSIDTKSGSAQAISVWPSKSCLPEASHGGNKTPSGSNVALKSSATQNYALKTTSTRSSHGDSYIKSTTSSPGPLKSSSSPASGKESQPRVSPGGTPDVPLIREDRNSSSNQSNNCCQSFSGKEGGKSSSAGLLTVNKISTSTIRTRKNSGIHGVPVVGGQKETTTTRGSLAQKTTVLEKSQPSSTFGRAVEGPITEGSSHKLIVTISNRVRSPAHGVSGESLEDPALMSSRASSPTLLDKHEQFEHTSKDKTDVWQNDSKYLLTGSGEGAGSPVALPEEERSVTTNDSRRPSEGPPKNKVKASRSQASSFSPMNALIESCAKYSGANSSLSLEDDVGMNLLASVATGEMSRSDLASPTDSTKISTPAVEENCGAYEEKSKSSPENYIPAVPSKFCIDAECVNKEQSALECSLVSEDGLHVPKKVYVKFTGDKECAPSLSPEGLRTREGSKHLDSSSLDSPKNIHHKLDTVEKSNIKTDTNSTENVMDGKFDDGIHEDTSRIIGFNGILNRKTHKIKVIVMEEKTGTCMDEEGKSMTEIAGSKQLCEGDSKKVSSEGSSTGNDLRQKLAAMTVSGFSERENSEKLQQTACAENSVSKGADESNFGKSIGTDSKNFANKSEIPNFSKEVVRNADIERHSLATSCSGSDDSNNQKGANVERKKMLEHASSSERGCSLDHEAPQKVEVKGSKSSSIQTDEAQNRDSIVAEACSSAAGQTHTDPKIKFDLNEGFSADDGKYGEPGGLVSFGSTNVHIINSVPFSVNSISASNSASIAVAAAAKGPFVPPGDLVRSKRELGWKGSAATSAFRPAEPRKFLETAFGSTSNACSDASISKHGRIPLDFDLNVPDERILEEIASRDSAVAVCSTTGFVSNHATSLNESLSSVLVPGTGGLDLDLNRVDEATENAYCSSSNYQKREGSIARIQSLGGLRTGDVRRDFDLNDGPIVDNASAEQFSIRKQVKGGIPSQLHPAGLGMNSPGVGSYSSWFPPGNTYSTGTIPTILPDRGDPPFPVFPPGAPQRAFSPIGVTPLTHDVYRGSVLSSSPAVPFSSSPFQFSVFPFGTTSPLPSANFSVGTNSYVDSSSGPRLFAPPVNSQFLGQVGPVASQFQRPYVVNLPDGGSNGMLENRKWGRQGLDLNAGPGAMEEVREDSFTQHPVASAQVVEEEQARMYRLPGGVSKRKEPEGGWDNESFRYKQFLWQ